MKLLSVLMLVFVVVVITTPSSPSGTTCPSPVPVRGSVLCCCQTFNGMCCAYVTFCGGFVPGCFCTG